MSSSPPNAQRANGKRLAGNIPPKGAGNLPAPAGDTPPPKAGEVHPRRPGWGRDIPHAHKRRGDIPAGRGYPPSAGDIPAGRDIPDRVGR